MSIQPVQIADALNKHGGSVTLAAKELGLDPAESQIRFKRISEGWGTQFKSIAEEKRDAMKSRIISEFHSGTQDPQKLLKFCPGKKISFVLMTLKEAGLQPLKTGKDRVASQTLSVIADWVRGSEPGELVEKYRLTKQRISAILKTAKENGFEEIRSAYKKTKK